MRNLLNAALKDNPYLDRGIMTGITRISKESIFSDLNHLQVVTTTSDKYADCFGKRKDIYNPWSVLNYLDKREAGPYWVNTSSNRLIAKLLQEGNSHIKESFEKLLRQECVETEIDEQIVYDQLDYDENAIWSLMLASGYLKVDGSHIRETDTDWDQIYELSVTNFEVMIMLKKLVRGWFAPSSASYNEFIRALLQDDIQAMNVYMNRIAQATFSYFDSGKPENIERN